MARTRKPKVDHRPLIDQFIQVRAQRNALEKEYQDIRSKILAIGQIIIKGTEQSVVVLERSRLALDTQQLKLDYGQAWYDTYCNPTDYYELEVINNG